MLVTRQYGSSIPNGCTHGGTAAPARGGRHFTSAHHGGHPPPAAAGLAMSKQWNSKSYTQGPDASRPLLFRHCKPVRRLARQSVPLKTAQQSVLPKAARQGCRALQWCIRARTPSLSRTPRRPPRSYFLLLPGTPRARPCFGSGPRRAGRPFPRRCPPPPGWPRRPAPG